LQRAQPGQNSVVVFTLFLFLLFTFRIMAFALPGLGVGFGTDVVANAPLISI